MATSDVIVRIGGDTSEFSRAMQQAERTTQQSASNMEKSVKQSTTSMERSFSGIGSAIAGAFVAGSVTSFARAVIETTVSIDSLNRSMAAVYGSQQAAAQEMNFLRETADRTGQNVYKLADSYKSLSASTAGTTLAGEQTRKIFASVSEASTVLGLSNDRTRLAFEALSQMASKGVVSMEELRGQLGDQLPGALNIAARAMGKSTAEFIKMVSNGEVLAEDLLPRLADALHDMYGAAAETAGLESGQAALNKLDESWTDLKANIGDSGMIVGTIQLITGALKGMSAALVAAKAAPGLFSGTEMMAEATMLEGQELTLKRIEVLKRDIAKTEGELARIDRAPGLREIKEENGSLQELNTSLADQRIALLKLEDAGAIYGGQSRELQKVKNAQDAVTAATRTHTTVTEKQHQELVKYVETEKDRAKAAYDTAMRGARTEQERAAATAKYNQVLEDLAAKETKAAEAGERRGAAAAKAAEAATMREIAAAISNYVREADKATKATEEWAAAAEDAREDMESLTDDYATAGMDEYTKLLHEQNKEFEEGKKKIEAFQEALGAANDTVSTAEEELAEAEAALKRWGSELEKTSLSEERVDEKTKSLAENVDKKREALEKARKEAGKLSEQNAKGAMTEEQLAAAIYDSAEALEKKREAFIKTARSSDDFFAGVTAGMVEMSANMTTMGELGYQTFTRLTDAWSDGFYAVLTGDMDELKDVWDSLLKDLLRMFVKWIAEMVAAWAVSEIAQGLGFNVNLGGGSFGGGSGGGIGLGSVASLASTGYSMYTGESLAGTALSTAGSYLGIGGGGGSVAGSGLTAGPTLAAYEANVAAGMAPADAYAAASSGISASGTAGATYGGGGTLYTGSWAAGEPAGTTIVAGSGSTVAVTGTTQLTSTGATTWGASEAAVSGTTGGGGAAAGGMTAAAGMGAFAAVAALVAYANSQKIKTYGYESPTLGITVPVEYGDDQLSAVRRGGRSYGERAAGAFDFVGSGQGGDDGMDRSYEAAATALADARLALDGYIDILANDFGDAVAQAGMQLKGTTESTDVFLDAITGYDVSMRDSASITDLATAAANGQSGAFQQLRSDLEELGMSSTAAETAATALVAGVDGFAATAISAGGAAIEAAGPIKDASRAFSTLDNSASATARAIDTETGAMLDLTSGAGSAAGAVQGMTDRLNTLSDTPLEIDVSIRNKSIAFTAADLGDWYGNVDFNAAGGVFSKPTLIPALSGVPQVVGEAGAEAITPLHAGPNTLKLMHDDIRAIGNRPLNLVINLDGKQIAAATMPSVDAHIAAKASRGQLAARVAY